MDIKLFNKRFNVFLICGFLLCIWYVSQNFGYAINLTHSLPHKIYIVRLTHAPKVNDYIVFKVPSASGLPQNLHLIKRILGGEGDVVSCIKRNFYVNGKWVGTAKPHSLQGEPLEAGLTGELKHGQFYVGGTHKDSFDSRYKRIGWIDRDLIVGVAYPLW